MLNLFKAGSAKYTVSLSEGETSFTAKKGETLLNSAVSAGIDWPFKCRVGSCGTCKCQLMEGKIKAQMDFGYVLDWSQIQDGYILACQSVPKSDIQVNVNLNNRRKK
jgi:CDP-4-dehydro-6-deoxyglucose reductase